MTDTRDRLTRRVCEHYEEICKHICADLGWYLVYEAALKAQEALHIHDDSELPENRRRLYNHTIRLGLARLLEEHVFIGEHVDVSEECYHEATEYFAAHVPSVPTYELSCYLNYLDSWSQENPDWTRNSPQAFKNLEIVVDPS